MRRAVLGSLPAPLFAGVFHEVVPQLEQRGQRRVSLQRPALAWAHHHFTAVVALDGSTLDALLRKTGLLREHADTPL